MNIQEIMTKKRQERAAVANESAKANAASIQKMTERNLLLQTTSKKIRDAFVKLCEPLEINVKDLNFSGGQVILSFAWAGFTLDSIYISLLDNYAKIATPSAGEQVIVGNSMIEVVPLGSSYWVSGQERTFEEGVEYFMSSILENAKVLL